MQHRRPAVKKTHCRIESLEGRALCTAAAINTHIAETPAALASYDSTATAGVVLHDGRLLAIGTARDAENAAHNVYAMYKPDGTLDQTFAHGGVAIQSWIRTYKLGFATKLYAMPDDSVLVQFADGLRRLQTNGMFDEHYGTNGVLPATIASASVQADGNTLALMATHGAYRLIRFDQHGNIAKTGGYHASQATVLSNGRLALIGQYYTDIPYETSMLLETTDFKRVTTFGDLGVVPLVAAVNQWVNAQPGRWYGPNGQPLYGVQSFPVQDVTAARDGGYVVDIDLGITQKRPPLQPNDEGGDPVHTLVHVHVSAVGKVLSVNGDDDRSATAFYPTDFNTPNKLFAGTFHFNQGPDAAFSLGKTVGHISTAVAGTNGYFMLGYTVAGASATKHFTVAITSPPGGTITGTLFNDHNHNGTFNTGETINAGRTVYIDSNNNGLLDAGEETTTTDAKGRYTFADLGAGQYLVRRALPKGYKLTTSAAVTVSLGAKKTFNIGSAAVAA